ncbi:MAG: D-alanyl-D-alanine carboxypeptidase family protein [Candidatus Saccharimonas sp.]|nr:D-alanyl-D-alanine carboxypeptidase family protein [Candidatus Saccharimonas sp.]
MPDLKDRIDQAYESGQGAYSASDLDAAEKSDTSTDPYVSAGTDQLEAFANDPANATQPSDSVRDGESSSQWKNNFSSNQKNTTQSSVKSWVKRSAAGGSILGLLLGGGTLVSFFGGPGLLIVNFVEQYSNRFNTQLASMDARMSKVVHAKLNNTTKGVGCKVAASAFCKFSTFSETELDNFKNNKLEPVDTKKTATGRYKISGFKLDDGSVVNAKDFQKKMKNDINFRNNMTKSYGGVGGIKYTGMWDNIANKFKSKVGINFGRPFKDGATDEDRAKTIDERSRGLEQTKADTSNQCSSSECDEDKKKSEESKSKAAAEANDLADKFDEVSSTDESASAKLASKGAGSFGSVLKGFGILGAADSACSFIGFARSAGLISKTTRLKQMILLSTVFLTTASMIKAGDAVDQDVSYVGNMLTETYSYPDGTKSKSATDSFGYRNAAYGDTGIDEAASTYVAGASFGGESSGIMQQMMALVVGAGGAAAGISAIKDTCQFVNNPFVIGTSLIVGIGALLIPGVNGLKLGGQIALQGAMVAAQAIMLAKVADITKGVLVGKKDSREGYGNIMNVASSATLMGIGNNGGNPLVKKGKLEPILTHYNQTKLAYAEMDRLNHSPFDATNSNTVLGSMYVSLMPYITKMSTPSGTFGVIQNLGTSSIKHMLGGNQALAEGTTSCEDQDPDVKDAGYAATEFCIPWTGTDPKYLGIDPVEAAEFLAAKGYLNIETDEFTEKTQDFITKCVERDILENPYGYSGESFEEENGKSCLIEDSRVAYFAPTGSTATSLAVAGPVKGDSGPVEDMSDDAKVAMYIHIQDKRSNDILENGLPNPSQSVVSNQSGSCSAGTLVPTITKGWTREGRETSITLCAVPGTESSGNPAWSDPRFEGTTAAGLKEIAVNSEASAALQKAAELAKTDGVTLSASVGYRSMYEQCSILLANGLMNQHPECPSWVTSSGPGWVSSVLYSNHMMGRSIDFYQPAEDWMRRCEKNNLDGTNDGKCFGFMDDTYQKEGWDSAHFTYIGEG